VVPIVFLASSLPISIGGHGVREGIIFYLLTALSADPQSAIALSVIYLSIIVLITLPGGFVLLYSQKENNWQEHKARENPT
jgi:hypothetical protein